MKSFIIVVTAICLFYSLIYAQDDCDSELKNETTLSTEQQKKYIPPLEKAYRLCKEGKLEEADKIVKDLKDHGLSEEVFDDLSGN